MLRISKDTWLAFYLYCHKAKNKKKGGGEVSSNKTSQQDKSSVLQETLKFRIPVVNDS